jgi:hypothetical protein
MSQLSFGVASNTVKDRSKMITMRFRDVEASLGTA